MNASLRFLYRTVSLRLSWLLLVLLGLAGTTRAQTIIRYVKPATSGSGDGSSWTNASSNLQAMIDASNSGQQVWVAAGTYQPAATRSFSMQNEVSIYGGFVGSESSLGQRPSVNPVAGQTTGSTLLAGDSRVINNPAGLDRTAVLDGFIITGGRAGGGGGMYNQGSSPSLTNCLFLNNSAPNEKGGGIYNQNSSPALTNCSFKGNTAGLGGGIYSQDGNPVLTNCSFQRNAVSASGGGMYNDHANPVLTNCMFQDNSGGGGGIYNVLSNPQLTNCSFLNNSTTYYGGGMYNYYMSSPVLINCSFQGNTATNGGGGMYNERSTATLTNCVVSGNGGTDTFYNVYGGSVSASYSLFDASVTGYTDGSHNLTTTISPFLSTATTQLNGCSPAINAGSNDAYEPAGWEKTDLAGQPRLFPVNGPIDMGAYEYQANPTFISVSNPAVATATAGQPFNQAFTASGGVSPYSYSVVSSTLPTSLSLSASGLLSGTPTQSGSYSLTVQAQDANGCVGTPYKAYVLIVDDAMPTLTGFSASPSTVCAGSPITFTATVGNVTGSYNYTLTDGASPITGTATRATFSQSLVASTNGSQSFTLSISTNGYQTSAATPVTVSALPVAVLSNNGPLTCSQSSVTLTASPGGLSYNFNGPGVVSKSGNTAVVNASGTYSVTVVNAGGCSATASLVISDGRTLPPAPNLSSLTVTQGAPTVSLTASNCSGTLTWNGPNGSSGTGNIQQATTTVGQFVYSATCRLGACVSPAATLTITVQATPASVSLSITHLDGDNNLTNNAIRPYLQLNNEGSAPIAYSQITVRYWLTAEDFSPLVSNLSVYYAALGTSFVKMRYVPLGQAPRQGAFGYVEYRFEAGAGSLAAKASSGPVQNGIGKNDWSNFSESNDYSFAANASYTKNPKITAYVGGKLVWGTEPPLITSSQNLKVYSESRNAPSTNTISTYVQVKNEGNVPLAYQTLKVRYFFTTEGSQTVNFSLDYAQLGTGKVSGQVVRLPASGLPVSASANAYLELSFTGMGSDSLYPSSSTGNIQYRMAKSDYTNFDQSNDYSYQAVGPLALNPKMSVYLNGTRVYGSEPTGISARQGVSEAEGSLRVVVLGNPVEGREARVEIRGVSGQTVQLQLVDSQGRVLHQRTIAQASELDQVGVPVESSGLLLLQVSIPGQHQTVKIMKVR